MQNSKQQGTEAALAIARDVEEQIRVLGKRVAALFVAVEEARGDSNRLSYVLSTHVANNVRGVHSHSHWSQPLPPMEGFLDAVRWSLYQEPEGGKAA
jgi:hypothetical protein